MISTASAIRHLDVPTLRDEFRAGRPFPFVVIDDFLHPDLARDVAACYPSFEAAWHVGKGYNAVNEKRKVEITGRDAFPEPVRCLHDALVDPATLDLLSRISGIPRLRMDDSLFGGGMHLTAPGGHLDVHVDFNYMRDTGYHRRLNILVFFNERWEDDWGGELELWNADVTSCEHRIRPVLNRCVLFATSQTSFHGVQPIHCPEGVARKSFAAYCYTEEPPAGWDGKARSTVFRARPEEAWKRNVLMPAERLCRAAAWPFVFTRKAVRKILRELKTR